MRRRSPFLHTKVLSAVGLGHSYGRAIALLSVYSLKNHRPIGLSLIELFKLTVFRRVPVALKILESSVGSTAALSQDRALGTDPSAKTPIA